VVKQQYLKLIKSLQEESTQLGSRRWEGELRKNEFGCYPVLSPKGHVLSVSKVEDPKAIGKTKHDFEI